MRPCNCSIPARAAPAISGEAAVAPWEDADAGIRALSTAGVEQVVEDFILAALRAESAGFDGVELHGAHGYLISEFLDGTRNRRGDGFGGSLEDRQRAIFAIIDGIRDRCGPDFQIGLRLSPERYGIILDEALQTASRAMAEGRIDYLDMSLWDVSKQPDEEAHPGKRLIDLFAALPRGQCRLGVAGKVMSAQTAQACLDAGADFVLIGRGAMLHHDFARRAIMDAGFAATPPPVTRDYLRAEGMGETFLQYVGKTWPDFLVQGA